MAFLLVLAVSSATKCLRDVSVLGMSGDLAQSIDPSQLLWSLDLRSELSVRVVTDPHQSTSPNGKITELNVPNLSEASIPYPGAIPISSELTKDHPLERFITQHEPLSARQFVELLRSRDMDLSIKGFHTGVVTAALCSNPNTGDPRAYHKNAWERDEAIIELALNRAGHHTQAGAILRSMWGYLGSPGHRGIITAYHVESNQPYNRFRYGDGMEAPHTKFSIDAEGNRVRCSHPWGMQQLDAKGAGLFSTYRIANQRALTGSGPELDLRRLDPAVDAGESIICATWKFLNRIRAWETEDFGPWERFKAFQRGTSIGIVAAATNEAIQFHERMGWDYLPVQYHGRQNGEAFKNELLHLHARCTEALNARVPAQGFAIECERTPYDSALALLLYPFTPQLTRDQEHSILRTVYKNMGPAGFRRYELDVVENLPDRFVGQDYFYNHDQSAQGEFANNAVPGYKAAEWSLFDPLLAGYWYRRFVDSGAKETLSFLMGDRHLKRSLSFVTKGEEDLFIEGKQEQFRIHRGILPEAKAWDTQRQVWRNNHNDLLMARAALALAFERGIEASRLWEHQASTT